MRSKVRCVVAVSTVLFAAAGSYSQDRSKREIVPPRSYSAPVLQRSAELQAMLDKAVNGVLRSYTDGTFKPDEIAATVIDMRDPASLTWASARGNERIYPASVVKMFYMVALERQLEDGKISSTPELARGLKDMIVDSSNEATQYILDVLTNTASGAELPPKEFAIWQHKRNRVNRFYSAMGYTNINTNQKTFCEDAYGIEQQSRNFPANAANRNKLTTDMTARLLAEIVLGRMNSPERTAAMMGLMNRDWTAASKDPDSQAVAFTGKALIDMKAAAVTKLWSKAGWTSTTRHDAAYIETPDGLKFVIVVFTENHANDREVIPAVVRSVIDGLRAAK